MAEGLSDINALHAFNEFVTSADPSQYKKGVYYIHKGTWKVTVPDKSTKSSVIKQQVDGLFKKTIDWNSLNADQKITVKTAVDNYKQIAPLIAAEKSWSWKKILACTISCLFGVGLIGVPIYCMLKKKKQDYLNELQNNTKDLESAIAKELDTLKDNYSKFSAVRDGTFSQAFSDKFDAMKAEIERPVKNITEIFKLNEWCGSPSLQRLLTLITKYTSLTGQEEPIIYELVAKARSVIENPKLSVDDPFLKLMKETIIDPHAASPLPEPLLWLLSFVFKHQYNLANPPPKKLADEIQKRLAENPPPGSLFDPRFITYLRILMQMQAEAHNERFEAPLYNKAMDFISKKQAPLDNAVSDPRFTQLIEWITTLPDRKEACLIASQFLESTTTLPSNETLAMHSKAWQEESDTIHLQQQGWIGPHTDMRPVMLSCLVNPNQMPFSNGDKAKEFSKAIQTSFQQSSLSVFDPRFLRLLKLAMMAKNLAPEQLEPLFEKGMRFLQATNDQGRDSILPDEKSFESLITLLEKMDVKDIPFVIKHINSTTHAGSCNVMKFIILQSHELSKKIEQSKKTYPQFIRLLDNIENRLSQILQTPPKEGVDVVLNMDMPLYTLSQDLDNLTKNETPSEYAQKLFTRWQEIQRGPAEINDPRFQTLMDLFKALPGKGLSDDDFKIVYQFIDSKGSTKLPPLGILQKISALHQSGEPDEMCAVLLSLVLNPNQPRFSKNIEAQNFATAIVAKLEQQTEGNPLFDPRFTRLLKLFMMAKDLPIDTLGPLFKKGIDFLKTSEQERPNALPSKDDFDKLMHTIATLDPKNKALTEKAASLVIGYVQSKTNKEKTEQMNALILNSSKLITETSSGFERIRNYYTSFAEANEAFLKQQLKDFEKSFNAITEKVWETLRVDDWAADISKQTKTLEELKQKLENLEILAFDTKQVSANCLPLFEQAKTILAQDPLSSTVFDPRFITLMDFLHSIRNYQTIPQEVIEQARQFLTTNGNIELPSCQFIKRLKNLWISDEEHAVLLSYVYNPDQAPLSGSNAAKALATEIKKSRTKTDAKNPLLEERFILLLTLLNTLKTSSHAVLDPLFNKGIGYLQAKKDLPEKWEFRSVTEYLTKLDSKDPNLNQKVAFVIRHLDSKITRDSIPTIRDIFSKSDALRLRLDATQHEIKGKLDQILLGTAPSGSSADLKTILDKITALEEEFTKAPKKP